MESLQLIKNRIGSIASTRQITQSMRLVSTSKVQKVRARMNKNADFLAESRRLLWSAVGALEGAGHLYLEKRDGQRAAVVVISGDRGLCGGYNIGASRRAAALLGELEEFRIITIGQKARDYCRRRWREQVAHSYTGISETPYYDDAIEIARVLLDWYNRGEVDQVFVVYTRFENMLVQEPEALRLLPVEPDPEALRANRVASCEPGPEALLELAVPFYMASSLFGCILESSACEQSARITSMDSAVKSADDMIAALTLQYNQARQSAITQEITEIVSGASAV